MASALLTRINDCVFWMGGLSDLSVIAHFLVGSMVNP